ncbi:MAG TPA: SCO family protein [Myxococcales bacterium]|nr:SCO family protein [Myxococcales bacterium]
MTAALLALSIATALAGESQPAPAQDAPVDVVERLGERVASAQFMDSESHRVRLQDLTARGKPVVLTLIYFDCPMLCSLVQKGVISALNETGLRLGEDYYGLTISFSPRDTIPEARLRQGGYLQTLKNAGRAWPAHWPFLVGGDTAIRTVADSLGFRYRYDKETQQYEHPAVSMVLGPDGTISRYFYGVSFPARDFRLAVVEASQGKVGTTLDRVILRCFKYDPASRKYHVYVMGVLQYGAGFFGLALMTLLGALWWREIRKAQRARAPTRGGKAA